MSPDSLIRPLTLARADAAAERNRLLGEVTDLRIKLDEAQAIGRHLQADYAHALEAYKAKSSEYEAFRQHYGRMSKKDSNNLGSIHRQLDRLSEEVSVASRRVGSSLAATRDQNLEIDRMRTALASAEETYRRSEGELRRADEELSEAQRPLP
jgi:chromosome segregation ATPase